MPKKTAQNLSESTQPTTESPLKPGYYASVSTLAAALEMSKATIWRLAKQGKFPPPVKLGEQMTRWKTDDVLTWLEAKGAA